MVATERHAAGQIGRRDVREHARGGGAMSSRCIGDHGTGRAEVVRVPRRGPGAGCGDRLGNAGADDPCGRQHPSVVGACVGGVELRCRGRQAVRSVCGWARAASAGYRGHPEAASAGPRAVERGGVGLVRGGPGCRRTRAATATRTWVSAPVGTMISRSTSSVSDRGSDEDPAGPSVDTGPRLVGVEAVTPRWSGERGTARQPSREWQRSVYWPVVTADVGGTGRPSAHPARWNGDQAHRVLRTNSPGRAGGVDDGGSRAGAGDGGVTHVGAALAG